jgi:hypothetical protein
LQVHSFRKRKGVKDSLNPVSVRGRSRSPKDTKSSESPQSEHSQDHRTPPNKVGSKRSRSLQAHSNKPMIKPIKIVSSSDDGSASDGSWDEGVGVGRKRQRVQGHRGRAEEGGEDDLNSEDNIKLDREPGSDHEGGVGGCVEWDSDDDFTPLVPHRRGSPIPAELSHQEHRRGSPAAVPGRNKRPRSPSSRSPSPASSPFSPGRGGELQFTEVVDCVATLQKLQGTTVVLMADVGPIINGKRRDQVKDNDITKMVPFAFGKCSIAPAPSHSRSQLDLVKDPKCERVDPECELFARVESLQIMPTFKKLEPDERGALAKLLQLADGCFVQPSRGDPPVRILDTLGEVLDYSREGKPVLVWYDMLRERATNEGPTTIDERLLGKVTHSLIQSLTQPSLTHPTHSLTQLSLRKFMEVRQSPPPPPLTHPPPPHTPPPHTHTHRATPVREGCV